MLISASLFVFVFFSAVEPVTDLSHVRLICMGFGILPDTKTLSGIKRFVVYLMHHELMESLLLV